MKHIGVLIITCSLLSAADFVTGQAGRAVIGQHTFTSVGNNKVSASIVGGVGGLAYANDTLIVADSNRVQALPVNNRVLVYRNLSSLVPGPTAQIPQGVRCPVCGANASLVIGQTDFSSTAVSSPPTSASLRTPTAVATDGNILAVADTDNNRVLIWKSIPQMNGTPADIVLGQKDFVTIQAPVLDNKSFRAPQGVWIQGSRLFVADTQDHRVMVWNSIPTSNFQPADYVLGEPNFTTAPSPVEVSIKPQANNLFYPVSVTSDGQRLFVADLGSNRVLIWNSIPTQTQQPADVVVGQPDMTSGVSNNTFNPTDSSPVLCASNGTDATTKKPTYPSRCGKTLSFPRYALSDGTRLFVADGGNDRVLVFSKIPTTNGARGDFYLGQPDEFSDNVTDSTLSFTPDANIGRFAPDAVRAPMSLAWDGTNLYVSDPYNERVLVFTPGEPNVPLTGITNAASGPAVAFGTVTFTGTINAGDTASILIQGTTYTYTVLKTDALANVAVNLANMINGTGGGTPDTHVVAKVDVVIPVVLLTAKTPGTAGNSISLSTSTSTGAKIVLTASNAVLSGGQNAAEVGPGTLVTINGSNLSDSSASGAPSAKGFYPTSLGGVRVYFDGIAAPLLYVSPTQINAQLPFDVQGASGVTAALITKYKDGSIKNAVAISVPMVSANPGMFAMPGSYPQLGIAVHGNDHATALVDVGGTITANNVGTVTVNKVNYTYTVQSTDTLTSVRDGLVAAINKDAKAPVTATATGQYARILLTARVAGRAGQGITVAASANSGATLVMTALQGTTCCSNPTPGALVTSANPAVAGEVLTIYATGLGVVTPADQVQTGLVYKGPATTPTTLVDDAQVNDKVADVISAGLQTGLIGVYAVQLKLDPTTSASPRSQLFIAQGAFTSNVVILPVVAQPK